MKLFRQLRWRILIAQMVVVLVGVVVLAVTANSIAASLLPTDVDQLFGRAVAQALLIAALAAALAGLITSLLLIRTILRPLNQFAQSSQRIAAGHYDERVAIPDSDELALAAVSFNNMAQALEQTEQRRIELIGNVAHELRTPLASLEGYLEGLVDGVFAPEPETFGAMQVELRRLHRLVNDLQSLSRIEAGAIELHLTTFDVVAVIRRVLAQVQVQTLAQCLELVLDVPDQPLLVHADADRTAQVLFNLLGNAVRYSPDGGCITVRAAGQSEGGAPLPLVQIEVQDNGIGIPAEALPLVFERFYRVDRSRTRTSGGSGIGLTITRHLVWAMGGDIQAVSAGLGKGSTFRFTLPAG